MQPYLFVEIFIHLFCRSPAYDLLNVAIVNPDDKKELSLTIAGKKKKITKEVLIDFGLGLALSKKQIKGVFERFIKLQTDAINLIQTSFLSDNMKQIYWKKGLIKLPMTDL